MIVQSISEKDLFEIVHRQIETLNFRELLYDENNFKMEYGGCLDSKTKFMLEVQIKRISNLKVAVRIIF